MRIDSPVSSVRRTHLQLFIASILSLFTELLLIRWIGTEINIFAYLQNTLLIVCLLGLGFGFFTEKALARICSSLPPFLLLVILLAVPMTREGLARISLLFSPLDDFVTWNMTTFENWMDGTVMVLGGSFLTLSIMVLLFRLFVPLGQLLGDLMNRSTTPLGAYCLNILGSLVGVCLFVALCRMGTPPVIWITCAALLFATVLVLQRQLDFHAVVAISLIIFSAFTYHFGSSGDVRWSPYQKLALSPADRTGMWFGRYRILVNNSEFQAIMDLSPKTIANEPDLRNSPLAGYSQYDLPFRLYPHPRRVLIVGAGTGNDVAAALRNGAEEIVAVEIDPTILKLGKQYHPEKPYESARVKVVNTDARAYFATAQERFDVISFGLLDSHTNTSLTNIRLDHYVYTKESLLQAQKLLAPRGIMTLNFCVPRSFVSDRIEHVLHDLFNETPLTFHIPLTHFGPGGTMFIAGDLSLVMAAVAADEKLFNIIRSWQEKTPLTFNRDTPVTTDDWPFLYLPSHRIPTLYWVLNGLLILLTLSALRRAQGVPFSWTMGSWHFLFLGAAFMLLEIHGITRAAAMLGNTWIVNAVIISAILFLILGSTFIVSRYSVRSGTMCYALLVASCIALGYFDLSFLYNLSPLWRTLATGLIFTAPMVLSGIIFANSFRSASSRSNALGANLIGTLLGAGLQSISFVTGMKALALVIAALYFLAFLCERSKEPIHEKRDAPLHL